MPSEISRIHCAVRERAEQRLLDSGNRRSTAARVEQRSVCVTVIARRDGAPREEKNAEKGSRSEESGDERGMVRLGGRRIVALDEAPRGGDLVVTREEVRRGATTVLRPARSISLFDAVKRLSIGADQSASRGSKNFSHSVDRAVVGGL